MSRFEQALVEAIKVFVREIANEEYARYTPARSDADWIPHTRWPFPSRRKAAEAAKAGRVPGARKIGQLWYTRGADIEAWVKANTETVAQASIVDRVELAFSRRRGAKPSTSKRGRK